MELAEEAAETESVYLGQCSRWEKWERLNDGCTMLVWEEFKNVVWHLHTRGFIPDTDVFYLFHLDLLGRNILVGPPDPNIVNIKGLIDWDSEYVCFCPKFVAYKAPLWVWVTGDDYEEDEQHAGLEPGEPRNSEAKRLFDDMVGEEWVRYAYRLEYATARRIFHILRRELFSNWAVKEAKDICWEWGKLYSDEDNDSSPGSSSSSNGSESDNVDE